LTIPLAIAFLSLMKKPRPPGFYIGIMCTSYAPVRFALDFLRARDVSGADPRYAGLTPAQWACLILLSAGLYFSFRTARLAEHVERWHPAHAPDPDASEKPVQP
jgi:phosphatidylglycerol:prolipoprotein diacylglycerol transferase